MKFGLTRIIRCRKQDRVKYAKSYPTARRLQYKQLGVQKKKEKNTIVLQKFGKCEAGKVGWGDLQFLCNLRKWINCCK